MILLDSNFWNYLFDTHHIIEFGGLFLILAIIYVETGFFLGFVLPGGDYMLFAAGIFCGTHYLEIPWSGWLCYLLLHLSWVTLQDISKESGSAGSFSLIINPDF